MSLPGCDRHSALDKLQQLVVQRLLELAKANLLGTGYKLHVHISKAIKAQSKAIRNALDEYNKLAPSMQPPAPQLTWNDIMNYGFLSKFELLKHSHSQQDVLTKPWTVPGNREIAMMYFKMKCLHEELIHLNVEVHQLQPLLAHEVEELRALPEFSGVRGTGTMSSDAGLDEDDGSPEDIVANDAFNGDMRFSHHRRIRQDNRDQSLSGNLSLHEHFCLNTEDWELAFYEGMSDIKDVATGMARITDALFIGFGLQPEWDPRKPLHTSDITVDVVTTRQFKQEIAMLHIWHLQDKLNKVTPGPGYRVDPETCQVMTTNIQLAAGQSLPNVTTHAAQRSLATLTPPHHNLQSESARQPSATLTPTQHHSPSESQSPRNASTPSTARSQHAVESHTSPSTCTRQPTSPSLSMQHCSESLWYNQCNSAMTRGIADSWVPLVAPATVFVPTSTPPSLSSHALIQHRSPAVTFSESSLDDSLADSDIATTAPPTLLPPPPPPALSLGCSNRPSWIMTPPGSPYGNIADEQLPPAYYTNPNMSSFNFTLPVQNFLHTCVMSSSMLCSIDTILDYSADCWYRHFVEVGLSHVDAIELCRLIIEGLSNAELDVVLIGQL
ncbi:hypothetical protein F4604DRAFT_1917844 [Suillus subluteus]|nr:hypothetical protein F4604DRAFT_1917844 [Suillus subluteus]